MDSKPMKLIYVLFSSLLFASVFAPCAMAQGVSQRAGRYAVILEDEPVAARFAEGPATPGGMRSAAACDYRRQLEARHDDLRSELRSRNFTITGSVTNTLNAVFVLAPPSRVAELKGLNGVLAVVPLRAYKRQLNRALALLDASTAWSAVGGVSNAGVSIKIAILDTGIDQTHAAFQDSSLSIPAGFPKCGTPGDCTGFTNNKVIVARSYVSMLAAPSNPQSPAVDSRPDDLSARDHDGHGTSVASAAAANTTTGLVTFNGMAPKAYLGSYKIYGSPGVNDYTFGDVVIQALDDAVSDGMDVISFSSGFQASTGPLDTGAACGLAAGAPCDTVGAAFENAAKAGALIVVSAGNDGQGGYNYPAFNTIESPADAPDVIAVGASSNSHYFLETIRVPGNVPSNLQNIQGQTGTANTVSSYFFGSTPSGSFGSGAFTLPLLDVQQIGDNGLFCTSSLADNALYGYFLLIERGTCSYETKVQNAQNAGAFGVIIYMNTSGAPIAPSDGADDFFLIPFIVISNANGVALKNYVDTNPLSLVTFDSAGSEQIDNVDADQLTSYSSVGPSTGASLIKPDLVAVGGCNICGGAEIYTAAQTYDPQGAVYSSSGFAAVDGTSLSAPLVAGAAAIVKQHHPSWTAAQIRSAIINNAVQAVSTDDGYTGGLLGVDIQSFGAGLLDAGAAVNATVTASPVSLSFGILSALPQTLPLTLTNKGTAAVTLAISNLASNGALGGATVGFSKTSVPLAAGASAMVNVTLSGTLPPSSEYSAFVQIQGTGVSLVVPYMYIVPDGNPADLFPYQGGFDGLPGEAVGPGSLFIKLTDDYGAPIANAPVTFTAVDGGTIQNAQTTTNQYGIATAEAVLGPQAGGGTQGAYTYTIDAGGMEVDYYGFARAQPTITAVENAASFNTAAPVAPGSYISILGTGLCDCMDGPFDETITGRLPLSLSYFPSTVSFDVPSAGISVPGHLSYASPTQINLQVPWELAGQKTAQMKVTIDFTYGNVFTIPIALYSPAFFEIAPGEVAAEDLSYAVITPSHPAVHGQTVTLYANGLGPVSNQPVSGDPSPGAPNLAQTTTQPIVTFGTTQATPSFTGLTPGISGLYQINVVVPSTLAPGNYPLTVSIGGVTSKASGIQVQ
jgi:minor extracellular serine protease Vpr